MALLFPSAEVAERCCKFLHQQQQLKEKGQAGESRAWIVALTPRDPRFQRWLSLFAVLYPAGQHRAAKAFWQHTGEGISSRLAPLCADLFRVQGMVRVPVASDEYWRLDQLKLSASATEVDQRQQGEEDEEDRDAGCHERAGVKAKSEIRSRIASLISSESVAVHPSDVFLYPSGMSAISNIHGVLLATLGAHKCICFGFGPPPSRSTELRYR